MMKKPRLSLRDDGSINVVDFGCVELDRTILIEIPGQRGRYLFTDASVAIVPCPSCKANIGEPCRSRFTCDHYNSTVHVDRKDAARRMYGSNGQCLRQVWRGKRWAAMESER